MERELPAGAMAAAGTPPAHPPPERRLPPPAEGDAKAFWTGLATVVAQYLLSCWLGGNARGSGRHGHSRRF